jgi:maltooligosyltrehalose trehalohydrolase
VATPAMQACLIDPSDRSVFERSKLKWEELNNPHHRQIFEFHKELFKLRRSDRVFMRAQKTGDVDGAVLGPSAWVLRYFGEQCDDRLVLVNLGSDLDLTVAPEPLLAPPPEKIWATLFCSEDPRFGGIGAAPVETEQEGWLLPGRCTVVLMPAPLEQAVVTRSRKNS